MEHKNSHWRTWYITVILVLVFQIILYYCFTVYYK